MSHAHSSRHRIVGWMVDGLDGAHSTDVIMRDGQTKGLLRS